MRFIFTALAVKRFLAMRTSPEVSLSSRLIARNTNGLPFECNSTKQYLQAYRFGAALQDEQAWNAVCLPQENVHPHILYQVSLLSVQYRIFHRGLQLKRFFPLCTQSIVLKIFPSIKIPSFSLFNRVIILAERPHLSRRNL